MVIKKQLCRGERNESSEPTPLCFGSWSGLRDGGREWSPQSLGAQTSDHSLIKKEDGMRQNIHPDRFSGHTYQLCSHCGMKLQRPHRPPGRETLLCARHYAWCSTDIV